MAKVTVKLNPAGVREFLNSPSMQAMLAERAQAVASRAGAGFEPDVQPGKNRAHGRVTAASEKARRTNLENNTLLKALGGGW